MSRDKQIEEMAHDMSDSLVYFSGEPKIINWVKTLENMYSKGYRKSCDVAREICEGVMRAIEIGVAEANKTIAEKAPTAKERRVCEIKAQAKGDDKVTYKFCIDIGKHSGEEYYVKLWDDAELLVHVDANYTEPGGKSFIGGHGHGEKLSDLLMQGAEKFICEMFGFDIKQG